MRRTKCPHCGKFLVDPGGPEDSPVLIVGKFPGWEETKKGRPNVGPAGDVLRRELRLSGINLDDCRQTNCWLHEPKKGELDWHVEKMRAELPGRKMILLLGSEPVDILLGGGVYEHAGLFSTIEDEPEAVVIAAPHPAEVLRGGTIGEVRLSLRRAAQLAKERGWL